MTEEQTMRIDKWLKIARFYKHRETAADAVDSGKVKVNGKRVKPAKMIKIGDILTVKKNSQYRNYTIKGISLRSISADLARELYEMEQVERPVGEKSEIMKIIEKQDEQFRREQRGKGRPTKRERRILTKYKTGE